MKVKIVKYTLLVIGVLFLTLYMLLRASLPELRGDLVLSGLSEPVSVVRDERGWPTLKVKSRSDAAQALGFLHAQERFFQMDLLRRYSAGELSELFGEKTLAMDKKNRQHQFRQRAAALLAQTDPTDIDLLKRYTDGVNQGLAALGLQPFEYLLLRQSPAPWQMEDSILVVYTMYLRLQKENTREIQVGFLKDTLTPAQFDFLIPTHSQWDAPLFGSSAKPASVIPPPPKIATDPKKADSAQEKPVTESFASHPSREVWGSNGFSVSRKRSRSQRAIVANDMHLGLSLPNTWYLATIEQQQLGKVVSGVSLPGAPLIIVGMTEYLAWGFTNSYGDWQGTGNQPNSQVSKVAGVWYGRWGHHHSRR